MISVLERPKIKQKGQFFECACTLCEQSLTYHSQDQKESRNAGIFLELQKLLQRAFSRKRKTVKHGSYESNGD
jgi:hypothetical protein